MTDPDPHAAATDPSPAALGKLVPDDALDLASPNLTDDQIFDRFLDWAHQVRHLDLWPHQEESILCLLSGDHVIANTPTGSGKSMIAMAMHFMALCRGKSPATRRPSKPWSRRSSSNWSPSSDQPMWA